MGMELRIRLSLLLLKQIQLNCRDSVINDNKFNIPWTQMSVRKSFFNYISSCNN